MFENLLTLAAEGERTTLESFVKSHPELKSYYDLGEKAAALNPRLQKLQYTELEPAINELEQHRNWKNGDWTRWQTLHQSTEQALAEARERIAEFEERTSTEMTPDEIRQLVKETLAGEGVINNAALEAKLTEKLTPLATKEEVGKQVNGLGARFEDIYSKLTPKIYGHAKDFPEDSISDLPKKVFDHMTKMATESGVHISRIDPLKAYDDMVKPRLEEKLQKDWEAKLVEAEKKGEQKGRQEERTAAGSGVRAVPVDGRGGTSRLGPVERRRIEKFATANKDGKIDAPLGKGIISQKASSEFRDKQNNAGAA